MTEGEVVYSAAIAEEGYTEGYDATEYNRTLMVDYLAVNMEQQAIHFTLDIQEADGSSVVKHDFATNIPVQRNHLTTILGNLLLTTDGEVKVVIEENFDESDFEIMENWGGEKEFTPVEPRVENGAYQVESAHELAWLAKYDDKIQDPNIQGTRKKWQVKKVVLTRDLDLAGVNWDPIDVFDDEVEFDGQGYTIRNVKINYDELPGDRLEEAMNNETWKDRWYFGLFGRVEVKAIRNLTVENVTVEGLQGSELPYFPGDKVPNNEETQMAGGVVGALYGGSLENCTAKRVFVKSNVNAGGVVGYVDVTADATFKNCTAEDVIVIGNRTDLGGFAGVVMCREGQVTMEGCSAKNVELHVGGSYFHTFSGFIGSVIGKDKAGTELEKVVLKGCSVENVTYYDEKGNPTTLKPVDELVGVVRVEGDPGNELSDWTTYVEIKD